MIAGERAATVLGKRTVGSGHHGQLLPNANFWLHTRADMFSRADVFTGDTSSKRIARYISSCYIGYGRSVMGNSLEVTGASPRNL